MEGWWLASYLALWALVVVLVVAVLALARQVGTLHLRLGPRGALEVDDEGPPLGEAPDPVDARALDGGPVTIGGPGQAQFVLFVSPGCPVCREVLPSLPAAARVAGMAAMVVADATEADARETYGAGRAPAPVVASPEVAATYRIPGTPFAVALDVLGVVRAKGTVNNLEQMEGIVDTARRRLEEAVRPG